MHFAFTQDQLDIRAAVAEALAAECTPDVVRKSWEAPVDALWHLLSSLGVLGINAPEALGGLALGPTEWVGILEESGRVALPAPLVDAIAAIPFLVEAGEEELVQRIVAGEARVCLFSAGELAPGADRADLILELDGDKVAALVDPQLTPQQTLDGSRRLFAVDGDRRLLEGDAHAVRARATLATAAQLLGLGTRVVEMAVGYAKERRQFGKPIGSFQAVQHHLVNARLSLQFAAPLVYRAAWSLQQQDPDTVLHVSMAKIYASEAARQAARTSLQVHGAIGYTFEFDLHLWMKRIWALASAWGDPSQHRNLAARSVLGEPVIGEEDA
jgi:alkylation response protein AidB-like acyl-CoA dehydrogenase